MKSLRKLSTFNEIMTIIKSELSTKLKYEIIQPTVKGEIDDKTLDTMIKQYNKTSIKYEPKQEIIDKITTLKNELKDMILKQVSETQVSEQHLETTVSEQHFENQLQKTQVPQDQLQKTQVPEEYAGAESMLQRVRKLKRYNDIMTIATSKTPEEFRVEKLRPLIPQKIISDRCLPAFVHNYCHVRKYEPNKDLLNQIMEEANKKEQTETETNEEKHKTKKGELVEINGTIYYKYPAANAKGYKLIKKN